MKTKKAGFLTERERHYVQFEDMDRRLNYKIKRKAIEAIRELALICRDMGDTWLTQQYKIFLESITPTLSEDLKLLGGDFSKIMSCITKICLAEGMEMVEREYRQAKYIQKLRDGDYPVISPEGLDELYGIEDVFTQDPLWNEELDNARLIPSTQILNPIAKVMKENGILFTYDFFSIESIS